MTIANLPPVTPKAALTNAKVLWFAFTTAPVIYLLVAEVARTLSDDSGEEGMNPLGDAIWIARAALFAWFVISSLIVHRFISEQQFLEQAAAGTEVTDTVVAAAMQTALILRFAIIESVAVMGLVLCLFHGERIDYAFIGIAIINLFLIRPTEDKWNTAFRDAATRYPGVSSSLT